MRIQAMNKLLILLLILTLLTTTTTNAKPVASEDQKENTWTTKAPMQQARGSLGVATVNGKIYAIGGIVDNNGGYVGTNEEYDPTLNTWVFKKPMPTPRGSFGVEVYDNKIYCFGGEIKISRDGKLGATGVTEVYDPAKDIWESKAPMPTPRSHLTANLVEGKVYLLAGERSQYSVAIYNPTTDSWAEKKTAPFGTILYYYTSAAVDNRVFIVGGIDGSGSNANLNQIFNVENETWSFGASAPKDVLYGGAVATIGIMAPKRVYVFGATGQVGLISPPFANQIYVPENNSWVLGASPSTSRINLGVAVLNDTIYAIGGQTYENFGSIVPSAANERYLPLGYGSISAKNDSPNSEFPIAMIGVVSVLVLAILVLIMYHYRKKRGKQR
jgi:hypothetical protein